MGWPGEATASYAELQACERALPLHNSRIMRTTLLCTLLTASLIPACAIEDQAPAPDELA